jgi:F-type H+-transporting ATPase subunit delta
LRLRLPILGELLRLTRLYETQHTAAVQSATPLPPELRAEFEAALERRYGPAIATIFSERPALIGGVRIQVGSDLYDASVRARLAALEKCF